MGLGGQDPQVYLRLGNSYYHLHKISEAMKAYRAGLKLNPNNAPLQEALAELAEGIRKELAVVIVSGTLAEPQVEVRTLSSLTAPLRELLNMVREQRQREAAAAK